MKCEPALFCEAVGFSAQFGINAASGHPQSDRGHIGVFVLIAVGLEMPSSHKYVEVNGGRRVKAASKSRGYSHISATQKVAREQGAERCFNLPSLCSSSRLFLHVLKTRHV